MSPLQKPLFTTKGTTLAPHASAGEVTKEVQNALKMLNIRADNLEKRFSVFLFLSDLRVLSGAMRGIIQRLLAIRLKPLSSAALCDEPCAEDGAGSKLIHILLARRPASWLKAMDISRDIICQSAHTFNMEDVLWKLQPRNSSTAI